ncbi:hypothetical protein Ancab_014318 [Ancistrocladus abbreviatus]
MNALLHQCCNACFACPGKCEALQLPRRLVIRNLLLLTLWSQSSSALLLSHLPSHSSFAEKNERGVVKLDVRRSKGKSEQNTVDLFPEEYWHTFTNCFYRQDLQLM